MLVMMERNVLMYFEGEQVRFKICKMVCAFEYIEERVTERQCGTKRERKRKKERERERGREREREKERENLPWLLLILPLLTAECSQ